MSDSEYWYCLKHHRVEGTEGEPNKDRLGPYATREEAEGALAKVQQRNEDWDGDAEWNDAPEAPEAPEAANPTTA